MRTTMAPLITVLECRGDRLTRSVEALVEPLEQKLHSTGPPPTGWVSGQLKKRIGSAPWKELAAMGPLLLGVAVPTGGDRLPVQLILRHQRVVVGNPAGR